MTEAWCKRKGYELQDLRFVDRGVSSFRRANWDVGHLRLFRDLVEEGEIKKGSILCVESLDRLSRAHVMGAVEIIISILNLGIEIQTLNPEWSYKSMTKMEGYEVIMMVGQFIASNHKSKWASDRIKSKWSELREKSKVGEKPGTQKLPCWLKKNDRGKVVLDQKKVKVIRKIFSLYANDGVGVTAIQKYLWENEIAPISGGTNWNRQFIKNLLFNRGVIGEIQFYHIVDDENGKAVRTKISDEWHKVYPAAISRSVFNRVQSLRSKVKGTRKRKEHTYLIPSNLILCGRCGERCYAIQKSKERGPYYLCSGRWAKKNRCQNKSGYSVAEMESQFVQFVSELDFSSVSKSSLKSKLNSDQRKLSRYRKERDRLLRDKDKIEVQIANGEIAVELVGSLLSKIWGKLNECNSIIDELEMNLGSSSSSLNVMQSESRKISNPSKLSDEDKARMSVLIARNVENVIVLPSRRRQDFTAFRSDKAGWEKFLKKNRLQSHLEYQRQLRCFYVQLKGEKGLRIVRGVEKMYRGGQTAKILNPRLVLDWKK